MVSVYSNKSFEAHQLKIRVVIEQFGSSCKGSNDAYRDCLVRMINHLADGKSLEEARDSIRDIHHPETSGANYYGISHGETVGYIIKLLDDNIRVRKKIKDR